MRKFMIAAAAFAAMVLFGCAPTPIDVCKTGVNNQCTRTHECTPQATKDTDSFKAIFGTDVADCNTKLTALAKCDDRKSYDEGCTGPNAGKKFDLGKAAECSSARKAQTCADYLDLAKLPPVCLEVCK